MKQWPNFFIVGAPKAGTTALHTYLETHPQVCMSKEKEPNYFSHEELASQKLYYQKTNSETEADYLALFDCNASARAIGEGSVSYLFYPAVAQRIHTFNAQAKIIISLREPIARAFSHYQMDFSLGLVKDSFDTIVKAGPYDEKTSLYYQQYILLSEYYEQVKRYLAVFGSEQVLIILHEDLILQQEKTLDSVCDFLQIDKALRSSTFEKQNVTSAGKTKFIRLLYEQPFIRKLSQTLLGETLRTTVKNKLFSQMALPTLLPETAQILKQHFQETISATEQLIGRDLSDWKKSKL